MCQKSYHYGRASSSFLCINLNVFDSFVFVHGMMHYLTPAVYIPILSPPEYLFKQHKKKLVKIKYFFFLLPIHQVVGTPTATNRTTKTDIWPHLFNERPVCITTIKLYWNMKKTLMNNVALQCLLIHTCWEFHIILTEKHLSSFKPWF